MRAYSVLLLIGLLGAACSGSDRPAPTPAESAGTVTATALPTVLAPDRTGIPAVDAVIEALLAKDGPAIAARLEMRECPPTFRSCDRLSEEERKQVFLASSCEGRTIRAQAAREIVAEYWSPDNADIGRVDLYGVYVPREDPFGLAPEYVIVIRTVNTRSGNADIQRLEMRGDRIVFIGFGCGPLRTESVGRWVVGPFPPP